MPDSDKPSLREAPEDAHIYGELALLVRRTAHAMDPANAFADPAEALSANPERARADDLARLRATEALREELASTARNLALRAGCRRDAPVTYADLGDAVGITRQSARDRFPGAVADPKPGRPRSVPTEDEES